MKWKIAAIFLCFSLVLCGGIGLAYYNTRSYGFDEDASVISRDDEKISILDYDIYYTDLNNIVDKARQIIPQEHNIM